MGVPPSEKPCKALFRRERGEKKGRSSRALTTCASPLLLRSGQSRGPLADHRQDDASEGSPTLISSLGREERGGRVMQIEVLRGGAQVTVPPPAPEVKHPPAREARALATAGASLPSGARGREDCSSRPSPPRRRQPRRLPPRATPRGSSRAAERAGSREASPGQDARCW